MDRPARTTCPHQFRRQCRRRPGIRNARLLRLLRQRRLRPRPNDVIQRKIIAKNDLLVMVDIDQGRQPRPVHAKEVQETAVLPERIKIILIVHTAVLVA